MHVAVLHVLYSLYYWLMKSNQILRFHVIKFENIFAKLLLMNNSIGFLIVHYRDLFELISLL